MIVFTFTVGSIEAHVLNLQMVDQSKNDHRQEVTNYKNCISYEFIFGLRYERILISQLSIGVNGYISAEFFFNRGGVFGVSAFTRYYPWNKIFFIGLGFGYHGLLGWIPTGPAGFSFSPELGLRISIGQTRFFVPLGINVPIIINPRYTFPRVNYKMVPYIGLGISF